MSQCEASDEENDPKADVREAIIQKTWSATDTDELSQELPPADRARCTGTLIFSVLVVTIGTWFQMGYNTGSINAPEHLIKTWMTDNHHRHFGTQLSNTTLAVAWSTAAALFPFGAMIGALSGGYFADCYGRHFTLHVNNAISIGGSLTMFLSTAIHFYPLFHFGRLIVGIGAGVGSTVTPIYVNELSPLKHRGTFGSMGMLTAAVSILFSQVLGLKFVLGTEKRWPWIFLVPAGPALLQAVALFFVPESPKFSLVFRSDEKRARGDLARLRGCADDELSEEFHLLRKSQESFENDGKIGITQLFSRKLRWTTTIVSVIMIGRQLSGRLAVFYYSTEIFEDNVFSGQQDYAVYATLLVGVVNLIAAPLPIWLIEHPRVGRRLLLLVGNVGMAHYSDSLPYALGVSSPYAAVAFILSSIVFFDCGPGAVPFVYTTEVFASNARASASSLIAFITWLFSVLVGLLFPLLKHYIGQYVFLIFGSSLAAVVAFIALYAPETKAKTLDQIREDVNERKPSCCP